MAAKLLWAALPGFVVLLVATEALNTKFKCPSSKVGLFRCANGVECIQDSQKCDGRNDCGDNSDETSELCPVPTVQFDEPTQLSVRVQYEKIHVGVSFSLCYIKPHFCTYIKVLGTNFSCSDCLFTFIRDDNENFGDFPISRYRDMDKHKNFDNGELKFDVERSENYFKVRLHGESNKWAQYRFPAEKDARLRVRPVYTRRNMKVIFESYSPSCVCDNKNSLHLEQRCDGRDDCGDNSDESPALCSAYQTLAVNYQVNVHVQLKRRHIGVTFVLSNDDKVLRLSLPVKRLPAKGGLAYMPETSCNEEDCNFHHKGVMPVTHYGVGEEVFVVERRSGELAVWLQGNPSVKVTVPFKTDRLATLRILPYTGTSKMEVRFEAPTVTQIVSDLAAELRTRNASEPCTEDCLARLYSKVDMATFYQGHPRSLDHEENWAVDWMRMAVASVSTTATSVESTMPLVFDMMGCLKTEIEQIENTNGAGLTLLRNRMANSGFAFQQDVTLKLKETLAYYKHLNKMDMSKIITSVNDKTLQLSEKTSNDLHLKRSELSRQKKYKILFVVLAVFSAVASTALAAVTVGASVVVTAIATAASTGIEKAVEFGENGVDKKIEDLNQEISKLEETQEDLRSMLPILKKSKQLLVKLKEAAGKNQIRYWLTGVEMQNFRAELVILPIENFKVAMAQSNMVNLLEKMATSLADALDKVQTYTFQQTTVALLTSTLIHHKDSPLYLSVTSLQQVIGENTLSNDFRATLQNLRMFAFPFCSEFNLVTAERCLSWPLGSTMSKCVIGELRELKKSLAHMLHRSTKDRRSSARFEAENPFYEWRYAEHNATIKALLSGEEVELNADVSKMHKDLSAIKFHEVYLLFRHTDPEKDMKLANDLLCAAVMMVHSGVSHFRCAQGTVSFKHRPFHIDYRAGRRNNTGDPESFSDEFTLFRKPAKPVLSPYTLWTVQLRKEEFRVECIPLTTHQLADEPVDILLVGVGSYVLYPVDCGVCGGEVDGRVGNSNGRMRRDNL